jgi:hypothetical protein
MGSFCTAVVGVWNWAMGGITEMCKRNLSAFNTI